MNFDLSMLKYKILIEKNHLKSNSKIFQNVRFSIFFHSFRWEIGGKFPIVGGKWWEIGGKWWEISHRNGKFSPFPTNFPPKFFPTKWFSPWDGNKET